jgi:hypothetical protein
VAPKTLTVRKVSWLLTTHPDNLDENNMLKRKNLLRKRVLLA